MKSASPKIDEFLDIIISNKSYSSIDNLRFKLNQVFNGIEFNNKSVLEIGGGYGLFSLYAAVCGAKYVVNIEPESDGSTSGVRELFNDLNKKLELKVVELVNSTFQNFTTNNKFDIVILYNSVNHLDEEACISLRSKTDSWNTYKEIFNKINLISNKNAIILICDASNINFFASFNLKNPFSRDIEWHKHQSPHTWVKILKECGFQNPKISWSTFNRFGLIGKILLGNRIASFFLTSHFCLKIFKN